MGGLLDRFHKQICEPGSELASHTEQIQANLIQAISWRMIKHKKIVSFLLDHGFPFRIAQPSRLLPLFCGITWGPSNKMGLRLK